MNLLSPQDIINELSAKNIQQTEYWFCDIYGFIKSFAIPVKQLTLENGPFLLKGFDGSSVHGMALIQDSDVLAQPDLTAPVRYLPWDQYTAAFHCNLYDTTQAPYPKDVRHVLKNLVASFAKSHTFTVSAKLEFYLLKQPTLEQPTPTLSDHESFYDLISLGINEAFITQAVLAAENMGIAIEQFHHEVAHSQYAIFLAPQTPVKAADDIVSLRHLLKRMAKGQGFLATFAPKPFQDREGSALKFCVCSTLVKENRCAFSVQGTSASPLTEFGKSFLAGLRHYGPETLLLTNQWINSYKRLRNKAAPLYHETSEYFTKSSVQMNVCGSRNPDTLRKGICISHPDAACNPYLALIGIISAGMASVDPNEFRLWNDYAELKQAAKQNQITFIANNLTDAIKAFEASDLMLNALGSDIYETLITLKKQEAKAFKMHVSEWEERNQLTVL